MALFASQQLRKDAILASPWTHKIGDMTMLLEFASRKIKQILPRRLRCFYRIVRPSDFETSLLR